MLARAGLEAYDPQRAGGQKPILNSISSLRVGMFDLYKVRPFRPILLISEQVVDGQSRPCRTAEETYAAAKNIVKMFQDRCPGAGNDDCILDPGIAPIGSDCEGNLKRLLGAMALIHADAALGGHARLGGPEQFHRHAALEAGRRRAGQRPLGKRISDQGHAAGAGHGHRLGETQLPDPARPTIPPWCASKNV